MSFSELASEIGTAAGRGNLSSASRPLTMPLFDALFPGWCACNFREYRISFSPSMREHNMADEYPIRYVAFIDILGFSGLVSRLKGDAELFAELRKILAEMRKPSEGFEKAFKGADFRLTTISDAIAMSTAVSPAGLQHLIGAVETLAGRLILLGYFIRGAIVKDHLCHDSEMVFGSGLVRAYSLESTVVTYPRVMVAREVVLDFKQYDADGLVQEFFKEALKRSKDGPYYLHFFRFFEIVKKPKNEDHRKQFLERIVKMRDQIERRLEEAVDNPRHYQKVHWLADYFNETFYRVDGVKMIEAPGLEITLAVS
ncbi:hypothetical protein [Tardiphaga robiniae]|uniref:Uncharacterized protein n=1 Tax=Tardiphaga robiniae TaxID=943830 RepID=A0A7G6TVH8_9BRAD|nr:hypothetical protein [Tardiphaga robiniae]QND70760.1 hypothetical protein HB776_05570 [Tardiphaga robiniae]